MSTVFVIGSINVDLVAVAEELPRPGETVTARRFMQHAGGKGANQAVAAAKLGADVVFVGRVGADAFGPPLRAAIESFGVDVSRVVALEEVTTGAALITVDAAGQNCIVVIPGANAKLETSDVDTLPFAADDVVLCQLEIPTTTVAHVFARARLAGALTILNAAPARPSDRPPLDDADIVVVNELELAALLGTGAVPARHEAALRAASQLQRHPEQKVVVTLGDQGAVAVGAHGLRWAVAGHRVEATDTTGAGDTFVGALAASLAARTPLAPALERANAAAAYSVGRSGAAQSSPTARELEAFLRERSELDRGGSVPPH